MEVCSEREEGEMSEDDSMSIDENLTSTVEHKKVENEYDIIYRTEKQGLFVDKLEKIDTLKIEERAKRFGPVLTGNNVITQKQIFSLYENIGINDTNERHMRLDTLHLYGVDGLTKEDVFEYLADYNPVAVESLSVSACNVLCKDHISAALALLANSKDIVDDKISSIAKSISSHYWRQGLPHPYTELILMRFATNSDVVGPIKDPLSKKIENSRSENQAKNPWGPLCQSWGVYDHQEVYGPKLPPKSYIKTEYGIIRKRPRDDVDFNMGKHRIISSNLAKRLGKRQYKSESSSSEHCDSDEDWKKKCKVPRMRMRADDEEKKIKPNKPQGENSDEESYPSLSIQIDNTNDENSEIVQTKTPLSEKFTKRLKKKEVKPDEDIKPDVRSRLGVRVVEDSEEESSDDSSQSQPETNVMSRIQRVPVENKKLASVWQRLDKPSTRTDLRHTLSSTRAPSAHNDLRTKLKESRKSPLRIEIDNEYYESD